MQSSDYALLVEFQERAVLMSGAKAIRIFAAFKFLVVTFGAGKAFLAFDGVMVCK